MNKEDLERLVGHTVDHIEYDDDENPTTAYIVSTKGDGFEVTLNG